MTTKEKGSLLEGVVEQLCSSIKNVQVTRNAENGEFKKKRPQIIFSNIVTLESGNYKQQLF